MKLKLIGLVSSLAFVLVGGGMPATQVASATPVGLGALGDWQTYIHTKVLSGIDEGENCAGPPTSCQAPSPGDNNPGDSLGSDGLNDGDIDCGLVVQPNDPCVFSIEVVDAVVDALVPEAANPNNSCSLLGTLAENAALSALSTGFIGGQFNDYISDLCTAGFPDQPDLDLDGVGDRNDNCPSIGNPGQEDADSNGIGDTCDFADADDDGIADSIDMQPGVFSDAFSDGTTSGTIARGDQTLIVIDELTPAGVKVAAAAGGGTLPATVTDSKGTTYTLTAGDQVIVTDGISRVEVLVGPIEVKYFVNGIAYATATLPTGSILTFDPETQTFTNGSNIPATILIGPPTNANQCKNNGWSKFNFPKKFKNQGNCVQYVNTGK